MSATTLHTHIGAVETPGVTLRPEDLVNLGDLHCGARIQSYIGTQLPRFAQRALPFETLQLCATNSWPLGFTTTHINIFNAQGERIRSCPIPPDVLPEMQRIIQEANRLYQECLSSHSQ